MAGYVLLVRDDSGRLYFVGRRDSFAELLADIDIYNRDPIQAGTTFGVHVNERGVVDWSDDWCALVDASLAGQIARRDLGPSAYGDTELVMPESLLSLEAARAAA